jgi:hypothetical protein
VAKTIWRGKKGAGRATRQSKTVSVYGKPLPPARSAADAEQIFKERKAINIPIPGEWLVDTRLKSELPKLNICKIRPERLRDMTIQQLERVAFFVGHPTKAERMSDTNPRGLLYKLAYNLAQEKDLVRKGPEAREFSKEVTESYRRNYPNDRPPLTYEETVNLYRSEANRVEMKIFDAQAKKKCPIAERDIAARDYIKSGGQDLFTIDRIRGKRRPKIR